MHKNLLAVLLSTTVSSICLYGAEMASRVSSKGDFSHTRTHYHEGWVNSVACLPDGERFVSGSNDRTVKLWGPNRNDIKTFRKHHHWVTSVACSPNGKYVISGSLDNTIELWKPSQNTHVQFLQESLNGVTSVALGRNGLFASTAGDGNLSIWSCRENRKWNCYILCSPLVMADLCAVACSPDGSRLTTGSSTPEFWIWDCETGVPTTKMSGHEQGIMAAKWDSSGQLLVSVAQDKTIMIWDCRKLKAVCRLKGHADCINSAAWSTDGQRLVSGSDDKTAMVWDRRQRKVVQVLQGHHGSIHSVDWSRGKEKIVTGGDDGKIFVWEENQPSNRVYSPPVTREKTILTPIKEEPDQSQTDTHLRTQSSLITLPMSSQQEEQESHRRWSKNLFSFLSCVWSC